MRNFLQPFWKVVGDADRRRNAAQPTTAKGKEARRRRLKSRGDFVETCRVRTALDWLHALLSKDDKAATKRTVNWRTQLADPTLVITCDASPWGLGAVLSTPEGYPLAWLASDVTEEDAERLGVKVGESGSQSVLESLAILVAVRTWAHVWTKAKARVHVRSDSKAALGALGKVSSPVVAMNMVAREVALDVAASDYGLEEVTWGHIAGTLNDWADALSRLSAPEPKVVPTALASFDATATAPRDEEWWRASAGPTGKTRQRRNQPGEAQLRRLQRKRPLDS